MGKWDAFITPAVDSLNGAPDLSQALAIIPAPGHYERFSQGFVEGEPKMLFAIDYFVDGEFKGILLVWKKYFDATHYEVYKRNIFSKLTQGDKEPKFSRVLFLAEEQLIIERSKYIDYIMKIDGIQLKESELFIFHDPHITEDRIYQYKVRAARVPRKVDEVDYDYTLLSQENAYIIDLPNSDLRDIYGTSARIFGNRNQSWMLALLNDKLKQFSPKSLNAPVSLVTKELVVPNNYAGGEVFKIIEDSIFLFGVKATFKRMFEIMGGLPDVFVDTFLDNFDPADRVFHSDRFSTQILSKIVIVGTSVSESTQSAADFLDQFDFPPISQYPGLIVTGGTQEREPTLEEIQARLNEIQLALQSNASTFIDPITGQSVFVPYNVRKAYMDGQLTVPAAQEQVEESRRFTVSQLNVASLPANLPAGFAMNNLSGYNTVFEYLRAYLYALVNPDGVVSSQTESQEDIVITLEDKTTGEQIDVEQPIDLQSDPGTTEGVTVG